MKILYRNRVKDAIITADNINPMFPLSDLYQSWIYRTVTFNGNSAVITFTFTEAQSVFCEAMALCNTNAHTANIKLTNADNEVFCNQSIHLKGSEVDVFEVQNPQSIIKAELTLTAANTLYIGYVYIGDFLKLPDFAPAHNEETEITTDGNRTISGQAYGIKGEVLRSWTFAFRQIDNNKRREIERYIDAVQYIEPHIVKAYDEAREPFYATLTKAGNWTKEKRDGFYWQTNLEFREAK